MFISPLTEWTQSISSLAAVNGCRRDTKMSTDRTVSTLFMVRLVTEVPKTGCLMGGRKDRSFNEIDGN